MQTKTILVALCALTATLASAQNSKPLTCPVLGKPVTNTVKTVEYAGLQIGFCCPNCDTEFLTNPTGYLAQAAEQQKTVATSLYDPVSRLRLDLKDVAFTTDFNGVRYPFSSKDNYDEFTAFPGLYTQTPTKESLTCPVKGNATTYQDAAGYADFKGVRYYFCCPGCDVDFEKDPEKYAVTVASHIHAVGTTKAPEKGNLTMAPTCAGCAGEARLLNNGNFAGKWMVGYRFIVIDDVKARHRFTLDYAATPRLTVGLERSGSDTNPNPVPEFTDNPGDFLRFSDGDALVLPRFSWFITPEKTNHPSLLLGMASDRLSTPTGQAFFLTASKSIPGSHFTPFVSIKTNSADGRTVFPFGVNYALPGNYVAQLLNDGDYTHLLFTKMMDRAAISLLFARSRYIGFSVSYGF